MQLNKPSLKKLKYPLKVELIKISHSTSFLPSPSPPLYSTLHKLWGLCKKVLKIGKKKK